MKQGELSLQDTLDLLTRALFADWLYLNTEKSIGIPLRLDTPRGEAIWKQFNQGATIMVSKNGIAIYTNSPL